MIGFVHNFCKIRSGFLIGRSWSRFLLVRAGAAFLLVGDGAAFLLVGAGAAFSLVGAGAAIKKFCFDNQQCTYGVGKNIIVTKWREHFCETKFLAIFQTQFCYIFRVSFLKIPSLFEPDLLIAML